MVVYRCMICGCVKYIKEDLPVETCKNCGMETTVPQDLEEHGDLYNEATYLRQKGDFEKAQSFYDKILKINPEAADAYFGRGMCRYGVRYKKSPQMETWRPECQVMPETPFCEDPDYLNALELSGREARAVFEWIAGQVSFAWQKEMNRNYHKENREEDGDELPITGSFLFFCRLDEGRQRRFMASLRAGAKANQKKPFFVHKSSYVDDDAQIGGGTRIGHFSHIQKGARIGRNCVIGQNVHIACNVKLGNDVEIQDNVSLYEGVELEDGVFCGASCVFANGRGRLLGQPGEREEYKETLVKRGASIGANATVICGNMIGEYAVVTPGSVVTENVPGYSVVAGIPAKVVQKA